MKVDLSGGKLFLKPSSIEEVTLIEKCQKNLLEVLSYNRVEKR